MNRLSVLRWWSFVDLLLALPDSHSYSIAALSKLEMRYLIHDADYSPGTPRALRGQPEPVKSQPRVRKYTTSGTARKGR